MNGVVSVGRLSRLNSGCSVIVRFMLSSGG